MRSEVDFPKLGLIVSLIALASAQFWLGSVTSEKMRSVSPKSENSQSAQPQGETQKPESAPAVVAEAPAKYKIGDFAGKWVGMFRHPDGSGTETAQIVIRDQEADPVGRSTFIPTKDNYFKCIYDLNLVKLTGDTVLVTDDHGVDYHSGCRETVFEMKLAEKGASTIEVRFWPKYRELSSLTPADIYHITLKKAGSP